jgi:hypothetical protein
VSANRSTGFRSCLPTAARPSADTPGSTPSTQESNTCSVCGMAEPRSNTWGDRRWQDSKRCATRSAPARHLVHLRARGAERDARLPAPSQGVTGCTRGPPSSRSVAWHDPTLHPLPGEGGQIRLGVRELGPAGHNRRSLPPRSSLTLPGRRAPSALGERLRASERHGRGSRPPPRSGADPWSRSIPRRPRCSPRS